METISSEMMYAGHQGSNNFYLNRGGFNEDDDMMLNYESIGSIRAAERLLSISKRLQGKSIKRPHETHPCEGTSSGAGTSSHVDEFAPSTCREEELSKSHVFRLLETLYSDHPGAVWRSASRRALEKQSIQTKNLIYGEISFVAIENLLSVYVPLAANQRTNRAHVELTGSPCPVTFYDLGCGAGRVIFTASLKHTCITKSCGIEILPSMHKMNQELLQLYKVEIFPHLHQAKQHQQIEFICGDFLQVDWSDANIIFMNATCYDDCLFEELERRATDILKEGSIVISVTRPLTDNTKWELLEQQERRMSWSSTMVYVYKKKESDPTVSSQTVSPKAC